MAGLPSERAYSLLRTEGRVLVAVARNPGLSITAVARKTGISVRQMQNLIHKMADEGVITVRKSGATRAKLFVPDDLKEVASMLDAITGGNLD